MFRSSFSRFFLIASLCFGCDYIRSPATDPADHVVLSLVNNTGGVIYLALSDGGSPLDAAVKLRTQNEQAFSAALSCSAVSCTSGCQVAVCGAQHAVRELAAGEAFLVEWNITRYDEGDLTCGENNTTCLNGTRAQEGRYLADVCFARAIKASQSTSLHRSEIDGAIILGAALDGEECLATREFGVPAYDVRHQIEIR